MNGWRLLIVGLCIPVLLAPLALRSQPAPAHAEDVASLQDTLEKGLKARFPEDFAYIRKVVKLVDDGVLTRSLVLGTFDWVRKTKVGKKKYLVPYFAQALKQRAAKEGIDI